VLQLFVTIEELRIETDMDKIKVRDKNGELLMESDFTEEEPAKWTLTKKYQERLKAKAKQKARKNKSVERDGLGNDEDC